MVEANVEMLEDEPKFKEFAIEEFLVRSEPYYRAVGDELELFEAAYAQHIPVLLKGPTGCGKTRFVEYMAWKLGRPMTTVSDSGQTMNEGEVRVSAGHHCLPRRPDRQRPGWALPAGRPGYSLD